MASAPPMWRFFFGGGGGGGVDFCFFLGAGGGGCLGFGVGAFGSMLAGNSTWSMICTMPVPAMVSFSTRAGGRKPLLPWALMSRPALGLATCGEQSAGGRVWCEGGTAGPRRASSPPTTAITVCLPSDSPRGFPQTAPQSGKGQGGPGI